MKILNKLLTYMLLLAWAAACTESSGETDGGVTDDSGIVPSFVASDKYGTMLTNGDDAKNAISKNAEIYFTSTSEGNPSTVKWVFYLDGRIYDVCTAEYDVATHTFIEDGTYDVKMYANSKELYYTNWIVVGAGSSTTDPDDDSDSTGGSDSVLPDDTGKEWVSFPIDYVTIPTGYKWELSDVSDEFNDAYPATSSAVDMNGKWTNFYHNTWTGPAPTYWQRDHVWIEDSKMKIKVTRPDNPEQMDVGDGTYMDATYTGCATSTVRVQYPVYVETYAKLSNTTMASDVWMLSADDTQEIDIIEAYGSDRYTNEWFNKYRLHLSHHVFIRDPFQDYQPQDSGSYYKDDKGTIWRDDYHRVGVFWRDPTHLYYYVDGALVRSVNDDGATQMIDPYNYTGGTGLSKEMDIIINMEDQTWRATGGLSPTTAELSVTENCIYNVEWIRVYQLVESN
ncbi:MAG: hypothetical protein SNH01_06945 [Rikenellaceae bacterium]